MSSSLLSRLLLPALVLFTGLCSTAQNSIKPKFSNSQIYTGIEVGSKGVKMSVIEIGRNAQTSGAFNILKDTTVNTDFISFTDQNFESTLNGLVGMYQTAEKEYHISTSKIFTVISSGVKMQAEKEKKNEMVDKLIREFRKKINDPDRQVEVVDVVKEAILSHKGIVPESRRFNTFLIDIGSGNTKGGFFPFGTTETFRLFGLNWGTKSVANATEKRLEADNTLENYNKQLFKVLAGAENSDIIYAVNASGSYPLSDNIAISGGIAWAIATLTRPDMIDNSVVSITYPELAKVCEKLYGNFDSFKPAALALNIANEEEKEQVLKETARVHKVFDQRSLMAGAGLLLKIMRQFASVQETKQFYLIKNGQVGWVSAYVNENK